MGKQTKNTKRTSAPTVQRISKEEFNKLRKRSIRNKVIAGVCTFIVGAGVGAGAYYGISDCWLNKDVPTPPPISNNNNIYFDCLDYQLTESEMATEVSKFYNREVPDNGNKSFIPFIKKIMLNSIDTKKTLYTPCFNIFTCSVEYESSDKTGYLISFNLTKLFVDNNLALDIPNVTNNYSDITWKIGKTNDTCTAEYGYAFRQLDNNDIILSIGFGDENAAFNDFMLDTSIPIEIDI